MLDESLFVTEEIHEKEVELADGSKHVMYFKELPAIDFNHFYHLQSSEDNDVKSSAMAELLSRGLCNKDGKRALTSEQAGRLRNEPFAAIFAALMEVNGVKGKGDSAEKSGSGTP